MKPFHLGFLRVLFLVFGLVSLTGLSTHAGLRAAPKPPQIPKALFGHFIYVEYTTCTLLDHFVDDTETVNVKAIEFELLAYDPAGQLAVYGLDHADYVAEGKVKRVFSNGGGEGCISTETYERKGQGYQTAKDYPFPVTPITLKWDIADKRFTVNFITPEEKGKETFRSVDTCHHYDHEPTTKSYVWQFAAIGAVGYNAKTKTYHFALFDNYTIPYRDDDDGLGLQTKVHAQGYLDQVE